MLDNPSIWLQDGIKHDLLITDGTVTVTGEDYSVSGETVLITNDVIDNEKFELTQSINSGEQLQFGACESSIVKFSIHDEIESLKDKVLKIYIIPDEDASQMLQLGVFKVYNDTQEANDISRQIIAYDIAYIVLNTDVSDWYNTLLPSSSSTTTLSAMRASFASYFGLTEEETTLTNDDMVIAKTIVPSELSGKDVLFAMAELNGVFPHITNEGLLRYVQLGVVNQNAYEISEDDYERINFKSYKAEAITKLQIRQEENDIGVIVGTGDNSYIVQDNFLVYGKNTEELTEIAQNMFDVISIPWYIPTSLECVGNPCLEVGDNILVEGIYTYVLQRTISGIQGLVDSIQANGSEYQDGNVNSIEKTFRQLKGKTNILERSIEETRSTITDVEAGLQTQITQNANGITAEITERENAVTDLNARITATSDSFNVQIQYLQDEIDGNTTTYYVSETPTLANYPAWDWCTNIPVNGTVQLTENGVPFIYTEADYQAHSRSLAYDEANVTSYRFRKTNDVWGWVVIGDSDYTHVLQQLSELNVAQQGITARVNTIEANTYSKTEADTKISISAQGVLSTVSQTYTTKSETQGVVADYTSKFSQTASEISAKVSQTGGTASSFAWSLTSSAFVLTSGNTEVFRCNSGGITINGYAKSNELSALSGRIDNLQSIAITTQNLSAQTINGNQIRGLTISANQITSGTISANLINTHDLATSGFSTETLHCDSLYAYSASIPGNIHSLGIIVTDGWYGDIYAQLSPSLNYLGGNVMIKGKTVSWTYNSQMGAWVLTGE